MKSQNLFRSFLLLFFVALWCNASFSQSSQASGNDWIIQGKTTYNLNGAKIKVGGTLVEYNFPYAGDILLETYSGYGGPGQVEFKNSGGGYLKFEPYGTMWYKFITNCSKYMFDKPVIVRNTLYSSNGNLNLEAASNNYVQIQPRSSSYGLILREYNSSDYGNIEVTSEGLGLGYNTSGYKMLINTSGNIGVGCNPGSTTFKIYGSTNPSFELASSVSRLQIGAATSGWSYAHGSKAGDIVFRPLGGVDNHHGMIFYLPNDNNDGNSYIAFGDDANNLWMKINNNRTVRVNGTVIATKMMVKTDVWSDYVFDSDYKLKSLDEIETFIKDKKHLPDVPSANQVIEQGIDVAQMNAILLKKIEELTLLMIKQNKTIQSLQSKVNEIQK